MFTWNFQYVSRARLTDTLNQLMLNAQKGDVLVRIHTAIHNEEEAVDLARFVKNLVPRAKIFGTSTSAVINWGKLESNQCVISVTQMDACEVSTVFVPFGDGETNGMISPAGICEKMKVAAGAEDLKLALVFATKKYEHVNRFVEACNEAFSGIQMIGGIACASTISAKRNSDCGFVFDETGWFHDGILIAVLKGKSVEALTSFASGAQTIGDEMIITEAKGNSILEVDGKDAAKEWLRGLDEQAKTGTALTDLLPFVYSEDGNAPLRAWISENKICTDQNVAKGKKLKRAFLYDRKIIEENRSLFRQVEYFEKAETIFGYTDALRLSLYPNCAKWEISAYENSNICGCVTGGVISYANGKNVFADLSFAVSVFGEKEYTQEYNPYVFSHTELLAEDNKRMIQFMIEMEKRFASKDKNVPEDSRETIKDLFQACEVKLFYSEHEDIPNEAALQMDVKLKGIDRICVISVLDVASMQLVFSKDMIQMTYKNFVSKCMSFAKRKKFRFYVIDKWRVAIGAPSYVISLADFTNDMENLHRELFESSEEYVSIVPLFCIMYNCSAENVVSTYNSARMEMTNKNVQFFVRDASEEHLDEESIRNRYEMVNVINYAISHDTVIPYYQGIFDNRRQTIHHYEALMRLVDENGMVYGPKDFLGVARAFGLMYDSLSLIMIKKVFERFKNEEGKSVSINIGIRDIKNPRILEFIYDSLSTMKHPESFIFEFLENEDVEDYNILVTFVDKIHELGGKIAIDDFGSGYSNLQHVLSIHSDYLKIDGSIVRNCCVDKESENLIALITGWRNLSTRNVKIVAEFVENEDIQKKMTIYNIDYSQGYLFSKPSREI